MDSKNISSVTISARVIRANGTIEDLGEIASTEKKNIFQKLIKKVRNNG